MGKIIVLPRAVADQIAAGEVVERPASVVKELVENALDAGASEVGVDLESGGRTVIVVSDDGVGMNRDDAVLATDRYATSKIKRASDLVGVATYGFRGEALPAVASVSRFELETAPRSTDDESHEGTRILIDGGRVETVETSARQPGTTVTVKRLFFNIPARRKFLRSQRSETRAAVESLTVLALARLDVSFRLKSEGRALVDAPRVSSVADRVVSLFGRKLGEELLPVEYNEGVVSVRGLVQRPADAKPSGRKAYLFVNGRPFRDPFLIRAAEAGYRTAISPGCRPTMFLSIGVPGDALDVNVHPAKREVRFRDKFLVERAVEEAVRHAISPFEASAAVGAFGASSAQPFRSSFAPAGSIGAQADAEEVATVSLFAPGSEAQSRLAEDQRPLLQILDTYIAFETPEGVAFVDQHSAHERVIFELTMTHLSGHGSAAQHLLLPITVELQPNELEAVEQYGELLKSIGFEVEPFGGRSVVLHAVPNPHPRFDAKRCFEEVVADLARERFGGMANRLERFAATYACRAAIKAGQKLEAEEMRNLVRRLFACTLPPHDVHGRPTIVQLPKDELERRFGRA